MYTRVDVSRVSHNNRQETRWTFVNIDDQVFLDEYAEYTRTDTRRKADLVEGRVYSRLMLRRTTLAQPPLPRDVLEEGLQKLRDKIQYGGHILIQE